MIAARSSRRARQIAQALWIVWAIVVWNVVFDQIIVLAAREYLVAALTAARDGGAYARMDDWMGPAVTHALWVATAASAAILIVGLTAIHWVANRDRTAVR